MSEKAIAVMMAIFTAGAVGGFVYSWNQEEVIPLFLCLVLVGIFGFFARHFWKMR